MKALVKLSPESLGSPWMWDRVLVGWLEVLADRIYNEDERLVKEVEDACDEDERRMERDDAERAALVPLARK